MILLLAMAHAATPSDLVPTESEWQYLDDGIGPGPGWTDPSYDDSTWSDGSGVLGFGVFEDTTIDGGPSKARHVTTWFRHTFSVTNPGDVDGLTLDLLRDDGAVVYLNGVEVVRDNLPAPSDASTLATADVTGLGESSFATHAVDPALLVAGDNVLAVEVHQSSTVSDDLAFDLGLVAWSGDPAITRGPYLQNATPSSIVVRWRTDRPAVGWITTDEGPDATGALALDHAVELAGLAPDTDYTYTVGADALTLVGGADPHRFTTPPLPGTVQPIKIWVIGDAGTADANAEAVADAFMGLGEEADFWLMLGDNAYNSGTDDEYQAAVFDLYTELLPALPLWSTLGNHDGYTADSATQTGPYYEIFTLPTQGEAGGEPSGSEAYYSFDWGNVHVICLDSYHSDRQPGSAMLTWLEDDLASTTADWVIAFFHHPPYTKGSHNSDIEGNLIDMRSHSLPLLEAYGVDLVLAGHSHSYERSMLVDGHYGPSETFTTQMIRDGGIGAPAIDGGYTKPSLSGGAGEGAVYAVAGSSGKISGGSLDHPVMLTNLNVLGSMVLDIDGTTLTGRFIDDVGDERDVFRIERGVTSILELWADPDPVVEGQGTALHAYGQDPAGQEVISYSWDFGDGQPPSTGPDQARLWADDQVVPITVTVEDAAGEVVQRTLWLTVENLAPVFVDVGADFATQGNPVRMWAEATDVAADTVTLSWDFGDGSVAYGTEVEHVFADPGPVTVTVTANDEDGGESKATLELEVAEIDPANQTIYVSPAEEGRPVVLSSATGDGDPKLEPVPVAWSWDFHDGQPPLEGSSVTYTWPDDGSYPVTLGITDSLGGVRAITVTVGVANVAPSDLQLSAPDRASEGEDLVFTASAVDPGADTLSYTWSFGDGSPSITSPTATYAYGDDGTFAVTLSVFDGDGGVATQTTAVTVDNVSPVLEQLLTPARLEEGRPGLFTAVVTDPGRDEERVITWSLGDGTTAEGEQIEHTYADDGTAEVVLTIDDGGPLVVEPVSVTIHNVPPVVSGTPATAVAVGELFTFAPTVDDPGDDTFSYTLEGPDDASVGPDGTVRWAPTRPDPAVAFTLVVSDGRDEGQLSWTVAVTDRGSPPTVEGGGEITTTGGCGCQASIGSGAWLGGWLLMALAVRRRPVSS